MRLQRPAAAAEALLRGTRAQGAALGNNALRITGRIDHSTVAIQRPVSGFIKARARRRLRASRAAPR